MSIVLVGLTTKFAIGMSDGRVTSPEKTVMDENFKKLIRINPYVCIGVTGSQDFLNFLNKRIYSSPININKIKTDEAFEIIYTISKEIMKDYSMLKDSSVVIFGIDSMHRINSKAFCTKDYVVQTQEPKNNDISTQALCDYPNTNEIFQGNILRYMNIITGMEETIKYISTVDKGINDVIYTERINL